MQIKLNERISKFKKTIVDDLTNESKKISRKNKAQKILVSIFRTFLLVGLGFIILFPVIQQIIWGFHHPSQVNNPAVIYIPEKWSIINFKVAAKTLKYGQALFNTFRISSITMVLQVLSTALAGYAFARLKFKGDKILFFFVVLTIILPPNALMLSRSNYFATLKLSGSEFAIYTLSILGMGIKIGRASCRERV